MANSQQHGRRYARELREVSAARRAAGLWTPTKGGRVEPLDSQLADAHRRSLLRDEAALTAQFCGDPPPGYSALDRMPIEKRKQMGLA